MPKKIIVPVIFAVLLVVSVAANVYLFKQMAALKADPQAQARQDVEELVATVGALMVLPTDETPTVATVSDVEKLKDQAFFKNAQAGDKVLLYTNAKRAVLYSPTSGKIVEVAPINIGDTTAVTENTTDTNTETNTPTTEDTNTPTE